jgi:hypothetical protein
MTPGATRRTKELPAYNRNDAARHRPIDFSRASSWGTYPMEFAFFGDRGALNRLRDHLVAAGFREDASQSDEMLVVLRETQLDYESIGVALAKGSPKNLVLLSMDGAAL